MTLNYDSIISKMVADGHLGMTALSRVTLASAGLLVCIARGVDFQPDLGS